MAATPNRGLFILIAVASIAAIIWLLIDMVVNDKQAGSMWFSLVLWTLAAAGAIYRLGGGRGIRSA